MAASLPLVAAVPVLASADASSWHRVTLPAAGTSRATAVANVGARWVAVGTASQPAGPAVWRSEDGAAWEVVDDVDRAADGGMRDVVPASPGWVAVGSDGPDAAVWVANAEADAWRRVLDIDFAGATMHAADSTWAGLIVVGFDPDVGGAAIWRRDGDVWSRVPDSPAFAGVSLDGIETGSFTLLAVGEDVRDGSAAALASDDGISWRRLDAAELPTTRLHDAFWGGSGFTAVGATVGAGEEVIPVAYLAPTDGRAWSVYGVADALPSELTAVTYSGSGLIAVGFGPASNAAVVFEGPLDSNLAKVQDPVGIFASGGMSDVERGGSPSYILVAVGWTGAGSGDGPDARATAWTTALPDGRGPGFDQAVPTPFDISLDPVVVATGLAAAAGTTLLIPFPAALFNSTLEANGTEVAGWFAGLRRRLGVLSARPRRGRGGDFWQRPVGVAAFLILSAALYALLDPALAVDLRSLAVIGGLLIGLVVTVAAFALPTLAYHWARTREVGRLHVMPWTILVAVGCVALTRLTGFQPGYLYGLLIGFAFVAELSVADEGRSTAIASVWVMGITLVSWLGLAVVRATPDPDAPGSTLAATALTTIVVAGLEALVFGMLPLRFLPGMAVFAWSRRAWAAIFIVGLFGFLHVLVNPQSGYLADTSRTPLLTTGLLFAGFAVVSVGLWAYFRLRRPGAGAAVA